MTEFRQKTEDDGAPPITVIIPTLDSADRLPMTLELLQEGFSHGLLSEVIVSDGGSSDATCVIAEALGARVLQSPKGRGQQLGVGATQGETEWLLFLHDDSRLQAGWCREVAAFLGRAASLRGEESRLAAVFSFALDDPDPRARRVERLARWRGRWLGLPYGDQGLLIERRFYQELGGYRPIALMEDVDFIRRIGRRRLGLMQSKIYTSSVRYRRDGWWRRPLRNLAVLSLYFLGMPPRVLTRLYG